MPNTRSPPWTRPFTGNHLEIPNSGKMKKKRFFTEITNIYNFFLFVKIPFLIFQLWLTGFVLDLIRVDKTLKKPTWNYATGEKSPPSPSPQIRPRRWSMDPGVESSSTFVAHDGPHLGPRPSDGHGVKRSVEAVSNDPYPNSVSPGRTTIDRLEQRSTTRGPRTAYGPHNDFMWPAIKICNYYENMEYRIMFIDKNWRTIVERN